MKHIIASENDILKSVVPDTISPQLHSDKEMTCSACFKPWEKVAAVLVVLGLKRMTFTPSSLWFQHYGQPLMSRNHHRDLSVSYSIKLQTFWARTQSKCIYVWSCTFRFLVFLCYLCLTKPGEFWTGMLDWTRWEIRTSFWQTQTADYVFRNRKVLSVCTSKYSYYFWFWWTEF